MSKRWYPNHDCPLIKAMLLESTGNLLQKKSASKQVHNAGAKSWLYLQTTIHCSANRSIHAILNGSLISNCRYSVRRCNTGKRRQISVKLSSTVHAVRWVLIGFPKLLFATICPPYLLSLAAASNLPFQKFQGYKIPACNCLLALLWKSIVCKNNAHIFSWTTCHLGLVDLNSRCSKHIIHNTVLRPHDLLSNSLVSTTLSKKMCQNIKFVQVCYDGSLTPKVHWWFQVQNCFITPLLKSSYSFIYFEFFSWIQP
jgi:hypothetical protein